MVRAVVVVRVMMMVNDVLGLLVLLQVFAQAGLADAVI
jgi:hypothetical protein